MAFNPQVPTGNAPSGLSYSRGAGSDQSAASKGRATGDILTGLGGAVQTALAGADEVVKQKIYREVDQSTDEVQSLFGVDAATAVSGASGINQADFTRSAEDLNRLQNAYINGDLKASHYFGQLNTKVKALKARYPGYEREIDATVAQITGVNPANALVGTLQSEANAEASARDASASKWQSYVNTNQEWIQRAYPGYFDKPEAERPSKDQVMSGVAKLQAEDGRLRSMSLELEVKLKQGQVGDKEIENAARDVAGTMVGQTLSAGMSSMGNSYNEILTQIDNIQKSGEFASPEALQQLQMGTANLILQTNASLQTALSQGPYARLSNTQRKDIVEGALAPLQSLSDAINNEDYGLVKAQVAWIEATKNKNVADALSTGVINGSNVIQNIQIIREVMGPELFAQWLSVGGNLDAASKAFVLQSQTNGVLGTGDTLGQDIANASKTNPSTGKTLLSAALDSVIIAAQGPGSVGANMVRYIYEKSTESINQFKESQRPDVYSTMYGPRTTQGLQALRESDPEAWKTYRAAAWKDFNEVSRPIVSEIRGLPEAYSELVEVTFNRETGLLEVRPSGSFLKQTSPISGMAGPDPLATDVAIQEMIRSYQELNKMLLSLKPIAEAEGGDFTSSVDILLQSLGVRYSNPLSPDERGENPDLSLMELPTADGGVTEFLSFVQSLEAPAGYNQVYNSEAGVLEVPLENMTIDQVLKDAKTRGDVHGSSASGGLQIMEETLADAKKALGLTGREFFDQETQTMIGNWLLERRGLKEFRSGEITAEKFANNLAMEWAALPLANGKSYHSKVGKNRALTDRETFMAAVEALRVPSSGDFSAEEGLAYEPPPPSDSEAGGGEITGGEGEDSLAGASRQDRLNPGRNPMDLLKGGAGGGITPTTNPNVALTQIENAATLFARNELSSSQVRQIIKKLGWSGGVGRHNRSEIQVFDPDGKEYWITY